MKKVLSILLSLCLIFTSISCVLTQSVSAANIVVTGNAEDTSAFYTASNWYFTNTPATIGTPATVSGKSVTLNNDMAYTYGNDDSSLLFKTNATYAAVKFPVNKNTHYSFSYYIMCNVARSSTQRMFSASGIVGKDNTTGEFGGLKNSSTDYDGTHDVIYDFGNVSHSYHSISGQFKTTADIIDTTAYRTTYGLTGNKEAYEWVKVTHTFNSQDNEEMIFALRCVAGASNNTYLDNFELISDAQDFEDITNWALYYNRTNGTTFTATPVIDGLNTQTVYAASAKVSIVANPYGSDNCIEIQSNTKLNAVKLYGLKADTKYTVSLDYYIPENTTSSSNWFTAGIVKKGTAIPKTSSGVPEEYVASKDEANTTSNAEWHTFTLDFNTDEAGDYFFTIMPKLSSADYLTTYYDNITLKEIVKTTITFDSDDGSVVDPISGYAGEDLTMPDAPTKEGYEFLGWYDENEVEFTETTFPADDITVYAKWKWIDPNAKFELLENWALYNNSSYAGSTNLGYPAFTATTSVDGLNTQTWRATARVEINSDPNYTNGSDKSVKMSGNLSLNAVKLYGLKEHTKYTVSFDYYVPENTTAGSAGNWFRASVVKKGTEVKSNGNTTEYIKQQNEPNTTGTSKWNTFTLDFNTDEAGDYFFTITNTLSDNIFSLYFDNITLTEDATLVEVTYVTNSDSGIPSEWVEADVEMALPEEPTNGDKVFAGWYTDDTFTTAFDGVAENHNFTLYADWADKKFSKTSSEVVCDRPLYEIGSFGEVVTVSFDYKVVGGTAKYYPYAPSGDIGYYDNDGVPTVKTGVNGFNYKPLDLDSTTDGWQTHSYKHTIKLSHADYTETYTDTNLETLISLDAEKLLSAQPELYIIREGDAIVYLRNIEFTLTNTNSIATAYNREAAIKTATATGHTGIRVYNEINRAWIADHNIVEFGSLVTYADLLNGEELTHETVNAGNAIKGIAYNTNNPDNNKLWEENEAVYIHTSLLINIPKNCFDKTIVVRSYAKDEDGNVYYGYAQDTFELSVYNVVNEIDNGSQSDIDTNAFYSIYVTDTNYTDYADWCYSNGKTPGKLYNDVYGE